MILWLLSGTPHRQVSNQMCSYWITPGQPPDTGHSGHYSPSNCSYVTQTLRHTQLWKLKPPKLTLRMQVVQMLKWGAAAPSFPLWRRQPCILVGSLRSGNLCICCPTVFWDEEDFFSMKAVSSKANFSNGDFPGRKYLICISWCFLSNFIQFNITV